MNGLNNFDKTDRDYSLANINDMVRFWRSKVKGQGHTTVQVSGCKGIHYEAGASKPIFYSSCSNVGLRTFAVLFVCTF